MFETCNFKSIIKIVISNQQQLTISNKAEIDNKHKLLKVQYQFYDPIQLHSSLSLKPKSMKDSRLV